MSDWPALVKLDNLRRERERLRRERRVVLGFVSACLLILVVVVSCTETQERAAVPHVNARDATGRFVTPICPVCGGDPVAQWTSWRCPQAHVFATKDEHLPPVKPTTKL